MEPINQTAIYFIPRVILGILFFFQGYDKIFKVKIEGVFNAIETEYNNHNVPDWFLKASIIISSFIELIGGLLLIFGLFKMQALYLLGINMIMVALGFSYLKPVWDMKHFFPRLVLIIFLLFLPEAWDVFSIDYLLR